MERDNSVEDLIKSKIKESMKQIADLRNVGLTDNVDKIVNAKYNFFYKKDCSYLRCPCDPNNAERSCISDKCMEDILNTGKCHCNCYKFKG